MKLHELIENCYLDRKELNDDVICQVIRENYKDRELSELIRLFLSGIGSRHQVPGNIIYTLMDLNDWFKEYGEYKFKQQAYIILTILSYWDQMSIESRIELNL
jgi:hypothetical protein